MLIPKADRKKIHEVSKYPEKTPPAFLSSYPR